MHLILQSSGRSRSDCCNPIVSQLLRLRKRFRESFAIFFVGNGVEAMQRGQNKRLRSGESAVDKAIESVLQFPEGERVKEGTHMDRIYLDNAATTAVSQPVMEAMLPYYMQVYSNPSSIHSTGRDAKKAVERARRQVAAA